MLQILRRKFAVIAGIAFIALLGANAFRILGQDAPTVNLQSELNIGLNCPVSSTLNADQTQLWILLDNCYGEDYTVLIYDLTSSTFITIRDDDFAPFFESLSVDQWVSSFVSPFAYTSDEMLEVIYTDDTQDYDTGRARAPISGDIPAEPSTILLNRETLENLIPGYAGYPETTVYNADHTLAAVSDLTSIHVIDLLTGSELFAMNTPEGSEQYFPVFSPDSQSLFIPRLINFNDATDNSAALSIYSLPDGAITATYEVPTAFFWPSPDNRLIAGMIPDPNGDDSNDQLLIIMDLSTGSVSQPQPINEPAHTVSQCVNDGHSIADLNHSIEGDLPITSLIWLPDSSGFYTTNSYGGEALGGGRLCILNYSRLRLYSVLASN